MRLVQREAKPPFLSTLRGYSANSPCAPTAFVGGEGPSLLYVEEEEGVTFPTAHSEVWRDWEWDTDTQPVKTLT